jgi:hypothetical protein
MERFRTTCFQPRGDRLPSVESIRPLRRLLDPFPLDCEASIPIHRTSHSGFSAPIPLPPTLRIPGSLLPSFAIRNRGFSKIAAERGAS